MTRVRERVDRCPGGCRPTRRLGLRQPLLLVTGHGQQTGWVSRQLSGGIPFRSVPRPRAVARCSQQPRVFKVIGLARMSRCSSVFLSEIPGLLSCSACAGKLPFTPSAQGQRGAGAEDRLPVDVSVPAVVPPPGGGRRGAQPPGWICRMAWAAAPRTFPSRSLSACRKAGRAAAAGGPISARE